MIASGLRAFYSLEEMQGRRVIVLANLKPRNIGGFKSNGMVGGVLEYGYSPSLLAVFFSVCYNTCKLCVSFPEVSERM